MSIPRVLTGTIKTESAARPPGGLNAAERASHPGDGLCFVVEAGGSIGTGGNALEELERGRALELSMVGAVNEAHGPLANELLDLVGSELGSRLDRHRRRLTRLDC